MDTGRTAHRSGVEVRQAASAFARPIRGRGVGQLLTTFGPFIAACAAMYLVYPISFPATLALALPAGLLLVRVFIVQHDCGHGSFFASTRANRMVGRACSLLTLTPFANWARQHTQHHGDWSNLDPRKGADLYSACLTVNEYRALSPRRRLLHCLPRHPLIANLLLPPLVFLLLYRVPFDTPRNWPRERNSVYLTNAALTVFFGALCAAAGWQAVLTIHVSIIVVTSIVGVWLFTLQHRFETAHWAHRGEWDFADASMEGSSWLDVPRAVHWLTGHIGFHHIHHLNPRVPNYRLGEAHLAVQAIWPVAPLGLAAGLRAPWLTLWDEASGHLVSFRDAARRTG
ncbi:MAG: fatty acid desaturase [Proteobacteria bacterium]|nr:fatty acid desaturase [Pseudomonadota bacterium]